MIGENDNNFILNLILSGFYLYRIFISGLAFKITLNGILKINDNLAW